MSSRVVPGGKNICEVCPYCKSTTYFHKESCDKLRESWVWDPLSELKKCREEVND